MASDEQPQYEIRFARVADKEFAKVPNTDKPAVADAITGLVTEQYARSKRLTQAKKIKPPMWRIRAGNWRIIYQVFAKQRFIKILTIDRRGEDTYDDLEQLAKRQ